MKVLFQLFFVLQLITVCWGQKISDQEKAKASVLSFYNWYIGITNNHSYSEYVKGVEDKNGITRLETKEYFKRLDSLGVIGQEFIDSEKIRMKPCADLLATIPWTEFSAAEDFPYSDKCGFFYNYYWTGGQEPRGGVQVFKGGVYDDKATVEAHLYYGNDKANGSTVIVHLREKKGKWMIVRIVPL